MFEYDKNKTYYFSNDDDLYEVKMYKENKKLKKDVAYIVGDYVLPYKGKQKKGEKIGIFKNDDGGYSVLEPTTSKDKKIYSVENLVPMDEDSVADFLEEGNKLSDRPSDLVEVRIDYEKEEPKIPVIANGDDFLTRAVKSVAIARGRDIRCYARRFPKGNNYNMITNLETTHMKTEMFGRWQKILQFNIRIEVEDAGLDNEGRFEPFVITNRFDD